MPKSSQPSNEKMKAALNALRKRFGHRPDVTGYDIGYKWEGDELIINEETKQNVFLKNKVFKYLNLAMNQLN